MTAEKAQLLLRRQTGKLLCCPHCQAAAQMFCTGGQSPLLIVECSNPDCLATVPRGFQELGELPKKARELVKAWNRRDELKGYAQDILK